MKRFLSVAGLAIALALPVFAVGCGSDTGDSEADIESGNAEYDGVIGAGAPKITVDKTRTPTQSASGRLVGWLPNSTADKAIARFAQLNKWNEIKDADGEPMFKSGKVTKNTITAGNGELAGELVSAVTLKVGGSSKAEASGRYVLHLENTDKATKFLVTVVSKGNLKIDVKFVPYKKGNVSGVIVDASLKVKLNVSESDADGLADGLKPIFAWIDVGA
ncbi:MAG: hypothetical protein U0174_11785 [Polyangiaceae bacterium]